MAMLKITLKSARINANLTQKEVADKLGIDRSRVIKWENNPESLTVIELRKLLALYNVEYDNIRFCD